MRRALYNVFGWVFVSSGALALLSYFLERQNTPDGDYQVLIIVALINTAIGFLLLRAAKRVATDDTPKIDPITLMQSQADQWEADFRERKQIDSPSVANAILRAGEFAVLAENVTLHELTTTRQGAQLGTRVKVGSMPFYLGQSSTSSVEEWKPKAQGEVVLTNQRFIFVGDNRQVDVALNRITGIDPGGDGLKIAMSNRVKPVVLNVSNPLLWARAIRVFTQQDYTPKQ